MAHDDVDWQALQYARQQAVSGTAVRMDTIEQAIDRIGDLLSKVAGVPWQPISGHYPSWPSEDDPQFRKEPSGGTARREP